MLDIKNYYKSGLVNTYLYNDINVENNTLFSLYIINNSEEENTLILQLSDSFIYIIEYLLYDINNIIEKLKLFEDLEISSIDLNKDIDKHLSIKNEVDFIKHFFSILFSMCIGRNINIHTKPLQTRKQLTYYFNKTDSNQISILAEKYGTDFVTTFRSVLFKSINELHQNHLIIFDAGIYDYIIPDIFTNNSICNICTELKNVLSSHLLHYYLITIIISYINNNKRGDDIYCAPIIQITETILKNNMENVEIVKSNIKCDTNTFPVQLSYIINKDNTILLTMSMDNKLQDIKKFIHTFFDKIKKEVTSNQFKVK